MMNKEFFEIFETRGLPNGPNEQFTYTTGIFSYSSPFDVYQAPSNIEGNGMFAGRPYKKGEMIGLAHQDGQPASELGKMHNHDENSPTMVSKKEGNQRYVYASKDLKKGDELTTNYRMQPELEQPEDFQNGGSVMAPPRKGVRKNPDGSESTHLMATETLDGKNWFSFPTLFQDPDGTWIDMSDRPWKEAYEEAKKRGELIEFGTDKEAAIKFGEGSWKKQMQEGGEPTFKYAIPGYDQKQFLKEWSNSPMGQKLLLESLGGNEKALERLTKKRTGNLDTVSINMDEDLEGLGRYRSNDHSIRLNPSTEDFQQVGDDYESVLLHELSHSQDYTPGSQFNKLTIPLSDQNLIRDLSKDSIKNAEDKKTKKVNRYLANPTETRARLNVVRDTYEKFKEEDMPSVFDSEFTPSMLEEVKGTSQFEELQQIFSDEEIIQLLNTVAYQKGNKDFKGYAQLGGSVRNLIKKAGPKVMKYLDNLFSKADDVVKTTPAVTKQKGLYEMLPIKKLEHPTHYGTIDIDDGTIINALDAMKAQGKYADDIGYSIDDLVGSDIQYLGDISGRTIVNVPLPNGKSQLFYKSTGLAGKKGSGVGGTSEGLWQPYGGHASVRGFPGRGYIENWFIKDGGYADYYGSESFKNIANKLDEIGAEQGWDMSNQILKSNKKQLGGSVLKKLIKKGATYVDDVVKRFADDAIEFDDIMKLPDDQFKTITGSGKDYWKLVGDKKPEFKQRLVDAYDNMWQPSDKILNMIDDTKREFSAFYKSPEYKQRLMDGMKISSKEVDAMIDDLIKEMDNATVRFNNSELPMNGIGSASTGSPTGTVTFTDKMLDLSDEQIKDLIRHEFGHVSLYGIHRGPAGKILNSLDTPKIQKSTAQTWNQSDRGKQLLNYHNNPDEVRQRAMNVLSYLQKNNLSVDEFMDIPYSRIVNNVRSGKMSQDFLDLRQFFDPKDMKNYLNKAFSITAPIGIGSTMLPDMSGWLPEKQKGGEYNPYMDIDSTAQKRRTELTNAINKVVDSQGGDENLRALLTMTAFMENSLGANPDAYGRDYTRGAMSIDDIAFKNMFEKRKGARDYTTSQKKYFDWFEGLGFDLENMDKHLRENVLANVAAARYQYGNAPAALPPKDDAEAMYKYYMDFYNRTDADHKDRFMKGYDAFIKQKQTGGEVEVMNLYKKYLMGGDTSKQGQMVYDKLNRLFYNDAKQRGMTPQNYIMTYLAGDS